MTHRARPAPLVAGVLFLLLIGLFSSCSDTPTGTGSPPAMEGSGDIDPGAGQEFLLSTVNLGPGYGGRVEVWAFDLTMEADSAVAFDIVIVNATDRDIVPPLHFVITGIVPNVVTCLNPDGYYRDRLPYFDFNDDMGDDNRLTPGEATERVHARFGWPAPMSFSIGFRLEIGQPPVDGVIAGVLFEDLNEDGVRDDAEPGVPGIPVELVSAGGDSNATVIGMLAYTDRRGRYEFANLPAGVYRVTVLTESRPIVWAWFRFTTPNPLLVTLVEFPDGSVSSFLNADFGVAGLIPPPSVRVFGPAPVGPGSSLGTRVDSTFAIPPTMPPIPPGGDIYILSVEAPMVEGPYPMYIEKAMVWIDGESVYKYECPPDTLCPPPIEKIVLDPSLTGEGEHRISIEVLGSERSFLLFSIQQNPRRDIAVDGKHR